MDPQRRSVPFFDWLLDLHDSEPHFPLFHLGPHRPHRPFLKYVQLLNFLKLLVASNKVRNGSSSDLLSTAWNLSIAPMNLTLEQSKKLAAYNAVDHHVKPEHKVSSIFANLGMIFNLFRSLESVLVWITVLLVFIEHWTRDKAQPFLTSWRELFSRVLKLTRIVFSCPLVGSFPITGVIEILTTSIGYQSKQLIVEAGLVLGDVDQHPTIDVTLDGADE